MTDADLLTRARTEWCEAHQSRDSAPDGHAWHYTLPCPTDVVAALLGVLTVATEADTCPGCGRDEWQEHRINCKVASAIAAIEKTLEEGT